MRQSLAKLKTVINLGKHYLDTPSYVATLPKKLLHKAFSSQRQDTENNSLIAIMETKDQHTRCHIFNYWSANYHIDNVNLECELFTKDGKLVKRWKMHMGPNQAGLIEFKKIVPKKMLPFTGLFSFKLSNDKLYPDTMGKCVVEMYNDRFITSVHEQGNFLPYRKRDNSYFVQAISDDGHETELFLPNCLGPLPFNPNPKSRATIQLINHNGEKTEPKEISIPFRGIAHIPLSKAFPNAKEFLEGKKGTVRLLADGYNRAMIRSVDQNGDAVIWHNDSDKSEPFRILSKDEKKLLGDGTVSHSPAIEGFGFHTKTIIHSTLPFNQPYYIDVSLFDENGKNVFKKERFLKLEPDRTYEIDTADLLKKSKIKTLNGHVRITYSTEAGKEVYPEGMTCHTNISLGNNEAIMNLGAIFSNTPYRLENNLEYSYNSTKIFARMWSNNDYDSWVFLVNSSTQKSYEKPSKTKLILISQDGKETIEKDISIPANGSIFQRITDIFPNAKEFLSKHNGLGVIHVRDKDVRLTGAYLIQNLKNNYLAMDHFFGG